MYRNFFWSRLCSQFFVSPGWNLSRCQVSLGLGFCGCIALWLWQPANAWGQKRVLVIHSYHDELPWTHGLRNGINQGFQQEQEQVEVYHEFLDAKRYPDLPHGDIFLQQMRLKYQDKQPDLLMISDDPGLKFILQQRENFFPDLPIVFLGINKVDPTLFDIPQMTGVFERHSTAETAIGALRQTGKETLLVLNDSTETGQGNLGGIEELRKRSDAPAEIIIINDVTMDAIAAEFAKYPEDLPILVLGQLRQGTPDGPLADFQVTAEQLNKQLPNPLFAESVVFLGHGVVGGKVLNAEHHAQQAVDLAQQILAGQPVDEIAEITEAETLWVFDEQELKRFNWTLDSLPEGSQIINQELSFYAQNKSLVWVLVGTFVATFLIILLLVEVIRRRVAEKQLLQEYSHKLETEVQNRTQEIATQKEDLKQALVQLKKTQAQLIQNEKMASLGQMVAGIAHEINNPVNFIFGNLKHLDEYARNLIELAEAYELAYPEPTGAIADLKEEIDLAFMQNDLPKILDSMKLGTVRIREIVTSLRNFSRLDESERKEVNLHEGLDSTLLILHSRLKAKFNHPEIEVIKDYHCDTLVECYPSQLNQVFLNLIGNAIDALEPGAIAGEIPHPRIYIHTMHEEQNAVIAIADNGPGMTTETCKKIFDPFFTTKAVGKGTGLGLSIAHSIVVERHGGQLSCVSAPGEGAKFIVTIPIR